MSRFEQFERIDLTAGPKKFTVKGGLFAKDAGGNRLGLIVQKGSVPFEVIGTIQGIAKLPPHTDNSVEKYEFDGVIDSDDPSRVYIDVPAEALYYPGQMTVAIRNNVGDTRTVLATFMGWIDSTTDGTAGVPPSTLPDDIEEFIAELQNVRTAAAEATSAAASANTAALDANGARSRAETAATSANAAATRANTAAEAIEDEGIPDRLDKLEFVNDTLLDWYLEEHSGQVTPFTQIASATISGTNLQDEIAFDPSTTSYSGAATITGAQGSYGLYNIVLSNSDAIKDTLSYSILNGQGTVTTGNANPKQATMMIRPTSSSMTVRLNVPIRYTHGSHTHSTTYKLTITVTKSA